MKRLNHLLLILLILVICPAYSQRSIEKKTKTVLYVGFKLYQLELASWRAVNYQKIRYKELNDSIGGHISYFDQGKVKTIFWNVKESDNVVLTIVFDSIAERDTIITHISKRLVTDNEKDLIEIWHNTYQLMYKNKDAYFDQFEGISINLIPFIIKNNRSVFIITGPRTGDEILFGNDYILRFNRKNKLKKKIKLHESLVTIPLNENSKVTMHSHDHNKFSLITATDICTLLLYGHKFSWKYHIVKSKKYVSVWNVETSTLLVFHKKEYQKSFGNAEL